VPARGRAEPSPPPRRRRRRRRLHRESVAAQADAALLCLIWAGGLCRSATDALCPPLTSHGASITSRFGPCQPRRLNRCRHGVHVPPLNLTVSGRPGLDLITLITCHHISG
jgi:hypothetical protein